MDVLKFFTVRLCPWDMHLTGRRRRRWILGPIQKLFLTGVKELVSASSMKSV